MMKTSRKSNIPTPHNRRFSNREIEARGRRQSWDGEALQHANEPSFGNRGRNGNSRLGNQFSESDSAKRRGSNSSVDSRVVANELAQQRHDEIYGVMKDVQGFLKRPEGLPVYISKQEIFRELSHILTVTNVPISKKVEVTQLMYQLQVKELCGNRKQVSEVSSCFKVIYPQILNQLPSKEVELRDATIQFLQNSVVELREKLPTDLIIGHLADDGIKSKKEAISIATSTNIPAPIFGVPKTADEDFLADYCSDPLISSLYSELDSAIERQGPAYDALLRYREALGENQFNEISQRCSSDRQRTLFMMISRQRDGYGGIGSNGANGKIAGKLPPDGMSFGVLPNTIINKLVGRTNRTSRSEGAVELIYHLERANPALLVPYVSSFVRFLGQLIEENNGNTKVMIHILEVHSVLLESFLTPQSAQKQEHAIVQNLFEIGLDSKAQIKIVVFHLFKEVMVLCQPSSTTNVVLVHLQHKNAKMREDAINVIIYALLTFPSTEFDLETLVITIAPYATDQKKRVRQASMECLALLSQCLGPGKAKNMKSLILQMDCGSMYDIEEEIFPAIQSRISRRILPRLTENGLVEYGVQIPLNYTARLPRSARLGGSTITGSKYGPEGNDVDWIMKGSGSISRGSTGLNAIPKVTVIPSSGKQSLQSPINDNQQIGSSLDIQDDDFNGNQSRRSSQDDWNRHAPIPGIGQRSISTSSSFHRFNSESGESQSRRQNDFGNHSQSSMSLDSLGRSVQRAAEENQRGDNNLDNEAEPDMDIDLQNEVQERRRSRAYDTVSIADSTLDLRAAAQTPPPRLNIKSAIKEDDIISRSATPVNGKPVSGGINCKKSSLVSLGMSRLQYSTQFDNIIEESDDSAPGAFVRPNSAFSMARQDLNSKDWQSEVEGLEAIIRLIIYHQDIILSDIESLVGSLVHECKNLRSQVTRAAIQTLIILFWALGPKTNLIKSIDSVITILLTKIADTNRFIRADSTAALESMTENLTIHKTVVLLHSKGASHKNIPAKTTTARTLGNIVKSIGGDKFIAMAIASIEPNSKDPNRETIDLIVESGTLLLLDGSLDIRTEAKTIFQPMISHSRFEEVIIRGIIEKKHRKQNNLENFAQIKKNFDSLMKQQKR